MYIASYNVVSFMFGSILIPYLFIDNYIDGREFLLLKESEVKLLVPPLGLAQKIVRMTHADIVVEVSSIYIYIYVCNTLRGQHQSLELWYITDIPQFAVVLYQNIPQLQGYIPQLPYTACLALMRLRSV